VALNIKNREVERLAGEVAHLAKETKTEAIRRALEERKERLRLGRYQQGKKERLENLLQTKIWPEIPPEVLGRRIPKKEWEDFLGYGPDGV